MQVNPEDGPPEIYVTWSDPRMTDFENASTRARIVYFWPQSVLIVVDYHKTPIPGRIELI